MKSPEISVIMSTYNESALHLMAAIDSVLKQTFKDFEFLIVLDNPQNFEIKKCVENYASKDSRIVIIENERNLGLTESLNRAIAVAKGFYMSRMDADDIMVDGCLERELQILKKEGLDLVASSKKNIDQEGNILGVFVNSFSPKQLKHLLPFDNSLNHPTVLARLEVIRKEGGYRDIPFCEDYDLWIRMLRHGSPMRILPDLFLLYRIRPDGICASNAYKQYCSKRFVMKLYRRSRKEPEIFYDCNVYNEFLAKENLSREKQLKFNQAYKVFYEAIASLKRKKFVKFVSQLLISVGMDQEILYIILGKLSYQIRKMIVLRFI